MRKKRLGCLLIHRFGSRNHFGAVTRTVTRTRFLDLLIVTVSFTPLPATVSILIGSGFGLGVFTLVRGETSAFRDHSRILLAAFLFNFIISLSLFRITPFRISSNFIHFYPTNEKNIENEI